MLKNNRSVNDMKLAEEIDADTVETIMNEMRRKQQNKFDKSSDIYRLKMI